jgi:hypothetical protein
VTYPLPSLGNDTVTVLKRTYGAQNRLGVKALISTSTPTVVTGCSFQPNSASEVISDTDFTVAMWILLTPPAEIFQDMTAADAIQVDINSVPTVFEDFSDPQLLTDLDGNPDHYRIKLRKARG